MPTSFERSSKSGAAPSDPPSRHEMPMTPDMLADAGNAEQKFLELCKQHPSFADVFWQTYLKNLAQTTESTFLHFLRIKIEDALQQYAVRDEAIEQVLLLIPADIRDRGLGVDAQSRTGEIYVLRSMLRKHDGTSLDHAAKTLRALAGKSGVSQERKDELLLHASMLEHPVFDDVLQVPIPDIWLGEKDARHGSSEDRGDDVPVPKEVRFDRPTSVNAETGSSDGFSHTFQFGTKISDTAHLAQEESKERERMRKIDQKNIAEYEQQLRRSVDALRVVAQNSISHRSEIGLLTEVLANTEAAIAEECETLKAYVSDLRDFDDSLEQYARASSEQLIHLIARDSVKMSRFSAVKSEQLMYPRRSEAGQVRPTLDFLEETFSSVARSILGLRVRCEVYREILEEDARLRQIAEEATQKAQERERRAEARVALEREEALHVAPHEQLNIAKDADRETVEHAYAAATEMLDSDRHKDQGEIARYQRAMDVMLRNAPPRKMTAFAQREVQKQMPVEQPSEVQEGFLMRMVRAPGRWLRALFFGAALGAAGAAAVNHFVEDEKPVQETTGQSDDGHEEDGAVDGGDAALDATSNIVTHETALHETMWGIAATMLREAKLKATNANVSYLTHLIREANMEAVPVPEAMRPGTVLDVTSAARAIDEMLGKTPSQGIAVLGASFTPESSSDSAAVWGVDTGSASSMLTSAELVQEMAKTSPDTLRIPPTEQLRDTIRVMKKGDRIYTMVYALLREQHLNWTSERVNLLTQLVLEDNAENFRQMVADGRMHAMKDVWIPVGAQIDLKRAMQVVDEMAAAKRAGKKAKTVREYAKQYGLPYPIKMKFPS